MRKNNPESRLLNPKAHEFQIHYSEIVLLVLGLAVAALWIVPRHKGGLWFNPSFTGWVAPVANQIAGGTKLYTDGAHIPLPPLSTILIALLSHGKATWLTESLLNFVCQALTVLILYFGFARRLPRPVPLLAALATAPIYFGELKSILYDSLPQVFAAASAVLAVSLVTPRNSGIGSAPKSDSEKSPKTPARDPDGISRRWRPLVLALLGLTCAAAVLSKQNTGMGVVLGVSLVLLMFPLQAPLMQRLRSCGTSLLITLVAFVLLCLAMTPFMDLRGFVVDVFITGSEPKGGASHLAENLNQSLSWTASTLIVLGIAGLVGAGMLLNFTRAEGKSEALSVFGARPSDVSTPPVISAIIAALSATVLGVIAVVGDTESAGHFRRVLTTPLLNAALAASLFCAVFTLISRRNAALGQAPSVQALAAYTLVLFPTALMHGLSAKYFVWMTLTSPMVMVALATVFLFGLQAIGLAFAVPGARRRYSSAFVFLVVFLMWPYFGKAYAVGRSCQESWPEIAHLRGARMPVWADDMRSLVSLVRDLTPDATEDQVLLLPADPNVEAWFERPRPALSGVIIFADQYWDRYVDEDFRRLQESPPRVIIIGPRNFWRAFQRAWNEDWGTSRLIDRVQSELIPAQYELHTSHPILYRWKKDYLDVYLRVDSAAPRGASAP